jgi:subtilisin family serine protease
MASISGNFNFPSDKGIPARPKIDIASPGADFSTDPKEEFVMGGSGFATPMVTGLVASLLAENPSLTPGEVKDILVRRAKDGVVDSKAAIEAATGISSSPITLTMGMDEASGIGAINSSQGGDNGHGLTGLNSLNSVVSSGRFSGLKGDYGPGNGFGFK